MKILVAILLFSTLSMANEKKPLLVEDSVQLTNYNQKPFIKMQHKRKLQKLALISKDEVKKRTKNICKESIVSLVLKHKGELLFYSVSTKNCYVHINALDGSIISKVKENDTI